MVGEHIVDDRVWITRTTYPIRKGENESFHNFDCNKVLMLVRNPVDVLLAKMHAQVSGTRTKQIDIDFAEHPQFVSDHVEAAVQEALAINNEAFKHFRERDVPIFFVKFEQLVAEPQKSLEDIFKFLLDCKDIENTVVQRRIKEVVELGAETRQPYDVESNPPKPSMDVLTEKQQNTIYSKLYDSMEFFGYLRQDNLGDAAPGHVSDYAYFSPPPLAKDLREKYKRILQNPVGGKEPLQSCQFLAANADTLKRNAKYSAKYRAQKRLRVDAGKVKILRAVFPDEVVIKDPAKFGE